MYWPGTFVTLCRGDVVDGGSHIVTAVGSAAGFAGAEVGAGGVGFDVADEVTVGGVDLDRGAVVDDADLGASPDAAEADGPFAVADVARRCGAPDGFATATLGGQARVGAGLDGGGEDF